MHQIRIKKEVFNALSKPSQQNMTPEVGMEIAQQIKQIIEKNPLFEITIHPNENRSETEINISFDTEMLTLFVGSSQIGFQKTTVRMPSIVLVEPGKAVLYPEDIQWGKQKTCYMPTDLEKFSQELGSILQIWVKTKTQSIYPKEKP